MISQLKDYFDLAIRKPVSLCSTLLYPWMKTNLLTNSVLNLINMRKDEVVRMFQNQAEEFTTSHYKSDNLAVEIEKETAEE